MDLADLRTKASTYLATKAKRLAADKVAAGIKVEEDALKQELIAQCRENQGGYDLATVTIEYITKDKPAPEDWNAIYTYINDHDAPDLMQKRLHEGACKERWDDGREIPGVGHKTVEDIKVNLRD